MLQVQYLFNETILFVFVSGRLVNLWGAGSTWGSGEKLVKVRPFSLEKLFVKLEGASPSIFSGCVYDGGINNKQETMKCRQSRQVRNQP
jgi:hypothetical protein